MNPKIPVPLVCMAVKAKIWITKKTHILFLYPMWYYVYIMCLNEILLTICRVSSIRNLLVCSRTKQVPTNQYRFARLTNAIWIWRIIFNEDQKELYKISTDSYHYIVIQLACVLNVRYLPWQLLSSFQEMPQITNSQ